MILFDEFVEWALYIKLQLIVDPELDAVVTSIPDAASSLATTRTVKPQKKKKFPARKKDATVVLDHFAHTDIDFKDLMRAMPTSSSAEDCKERKRLWVEFNGGDRRSPRLCLAEIYKVCV
jgi:hypothetical protein